MLDCLAYNLLCKLHPSGFVDFSIIAEVTVAKCDDKLIAFQFAQFEAMLLMLEITNSRVAQRVIQLAQSTRILAVDADTLYGNGPTILCTCESKVLWLNLQ